MGCATELEQKTREAGERLDTHLRGIIKWHFSAETGCPFWLDWARNQDWNPLTEVLTFNDLTEKFPPFKDEWLRDLQPEVWVPKDYAGRPFNIFETMHCCRIHLSTVRFFNIDTGHIGFRLAIALREWRSK